jgi:type I restriction enzyme S subunit
MLYLNESQYEALRAGQLQKGDSVFCIRGSLGKHGVFPFDKGAIASSLVVVRLISSEVLHETYLELLFDSPLTFIGIRRFNNGTAQPNLAARDFGSFLYALPPLTEQRRIVERVEELMPLVEEYGELEDAREELDAALPERLRKSVLQMAVQGKLVPQDPSDEPASELLKRIRGQRRELVAEKKMKAPKGGESVIFRGSDGRRYEKRIDSKGRESDPTCIEDEIPFEIPDSWEWARLGSLCNFGKCQNIEYGCVAVGTWNLDLEDIEKETGTILRKKLKAAGENGSTKHIFDAGMVLYSKLRPYLNKVVVADEGGVCSSEILPLDFGQLNAEYASLLLWSQALWNTPRDARMG